MLLALCWWDELTHESVEVAAPLAHFAHHPGILGVEETVLFSEFGLPGTSCFGTRVGA